MGSSDFAVPILNGLNEVYDVVGVVTQPDRPAGRGRNVMQSPIKGIALKLGLPVLQPLKIKDLDVVKQLSTLKPDLIVVAAFGQILSTNILNIPTFGCINVHASLLPRWRGASPIQAAILAGDSVTGISIMKMDAGLDTGPILTQKEINISNDETTTSLSDKLSKLGATILPETIDAYFSGKIILMNQNDEKAIKTHLIKKDDGRLDFNNPAEILERAIRAYYPWPGTFFSWNSHQIKVIKAYVIDDQPAQPNQHLIFEKKPAIGTEKGYLVMDLIQPEGKKAMSGEEFLRGAHNWLDSESR